MASCPDIRFPEESSNGNSIEPNSNLDLVEEPVLATREGIWSSSSPEILELSKEEFRYQDSGKPKIPLRKNLVRSCPHLPVSEVTPLNSNAESSEPEESEDDDDGDQRDERDRPSYCTDFIDSCLDSVVEFRNSKLIHVMQALYVPLPISAVIMGLMYADKCRFLPTFSAVIGVIGTVFIGLWTAKTYCQQRVAPCMDKQNFTIGFIFLTLVCLVIIDMCLVGHISPSFTKGEKNYCSKTFYDYTVKKEILTAVAFALAALFYLPRSRHCFGYCNCCYSELLLPNVRYRSIEMLE